jgi:hypothetical protein
LGTTIRGTIHISMINSPFGRVSVIVA